MSDTNSFLKNSNKAFDCLQSWAFIFLILAGFLLSGLLTKQAFAQSPDDPPPGGPEVATVPVLSMTIDENGGKSIDLPQSNNGIHISWTSSNADGRDYTCDVNSWNSKSGTGWATGPISNSLTIPGVCTSSSSGYDSLQVNIIPPPTITLFTATPSSVSQGGTTTLAWNATNATFCTATQGEGFSTGNATSGSDISGPLSGITENDFTIVCSGVGGVVSSSLQVTISILVPPPTVTLAVTPRPAPLNYPATPVTVTWNAQNANSCVAKTDFGLESWSTGGATSGSVPVTLTSVSLIQSQPNWFGIYCEAGKAGNVTEYADVWFYNNVPPPSVIISCPVSLLVNETATFLASASGGYGGTISWSKDNVVTGSTGPDYSASFGSVGSHTMTAVYEGDSDTCTVNVTLLPTLTCTPPSQTLGSTNSATLDASGGVAPFSWSISSGSGGTLSNLTGNTTNLVGEIGSSYVVRLADSAGQSSNCNVSFTQPVNPIIVDLVASLSPANGSAPNNITLTWYISGEPANSCTASGSWSGSKSIVNGSTTLLSGVGVGSYSYTLFCSGLSESTGTDTENVTISSAALPPVVSLSLAPNQITTSQSSVVAWTVSGGVPTSCTASASPSIAAWTGSKSTSSSSQTLSSLAVGTYNLTLTCANGILPNGTSTQQLVVTAAAVSGSPFSGSITGSDCTVAYPGTNCDATITWTANSVNNTLVRKSVDGGAWSAFNCVAGGVTNKSLTDTLEKDKYTTYELYNAPNCSYVPGTTVDNNTIIMWDNPAPASFPAGWTCISCAGGVLNNRFPRAAAAYGAGSATSTHTHTLSNTGASYRGSDPLPTNAGPDFRSVSSTHTHTWPNITSSSGSNLPKYQTLVFLKANGATTLPAGAIAMFETGNVPADWSSLATPNGYYLRAGADVSNSASGSHTHSFSGTSGGGQADLAQDDFRIETPSDGHTHSIPSTNLSSYVNAPRYADLIFAKKQSSGSIPEGMITFFVDAIPTNWTLISGASSIYNQRFIMGNTSSGGTGGSDTHNHGGTVSLNSGASSSGSYVSESFSGSIYPALTTHYYALTYSISTATVLPPYVDAMLAKYNKIGSITLTANQTGGGPISTLVTSNKDIIKVRGTDALTYSYLGASEANLTNVDPIGENQEVTFAIHVVNSGLGTVTGDITITDTLSNLVVSANDWQASIHCNESPPLDNSTSCDGLYSLDPVDDSVSGRAVFTIQSTGGTLAAGQFLTLVYTAIAEGPRSSSSNIFRLRNEARIDYNDQVLGSAFVDCSSSGDPCNLRTPSVLFFRDLTVPFLRETF